MILGGVTVSLLRRVGDLREDIRRGVEGNH